MGVPELADAGWRRTWDRAPSRAAGCSRWSPSLFRDGLAAALPDRGVTRASTLVNYQHPHDMLMGLGGEVSTRAPRVTTVRRGFGRLTSARTDARSCIADRPAATAGPNHPPFHRLIAYFGRRADRRRQIGQVALESSVFRGAEPDDRRFALERPRLDVVVGADRLGARRMERTVIGRSPASPSGSSPTTWSG